MCAVKIENDMVVGNRKRLIETLQQSLTIQPSIELHEIAQHMGLTDEVFLNLFQSLKERITVNYELKPLRELNNKIEYYIQKKTSSNRTCGNCEYFLENKCSFWAARSHSRSLAEEESFFLPRGKQSKAEYMACYAFSTPPMGDTHAEESLGSDFVPNSFKYKKLRRINSSLNPHYAYKELDHTQALLSEYFPEELLTTAAVVIKSTFEPTESQELLFARFLASIDLELRASRGIAIRDSVYADILATFEISEDIITSQRRLILQNLPNHPLRREPVKYLFIILWNEIQDIVSNIQPPEAEAILKNAAKIVETLKLHKYNVINKRLFAFAILHEVAIQMDNPNFRSHLKEQPVNAKELYNATFRLRKLLYA